MARYWGEKKKKREPRNIMTVGEKYGRLTVIEPAGATKSRIKLWLCSCSCGGSKVVRHDHLRNGHTISCGCAQKTNLFNAPHKIRHQTSIGA
jgi:hypothetical protein